MNRPPNPLDHLIELLGGEEKVAELTGRGRDGIPGPAGGLRGRPMQSGLVVLGPQPCHYRAPTLPAPGRKGYVAKDDQERATYRLRGGDGPQKDVNMREKGAFMEGRKVRGWAALVSRKRPASSPAGDALGIVRAKG